MSKATKEVAVIANLNKATSLALTDAMETVPTAGNFELLTGNYFSFKDKVGETINFICNGLCDGSDYNDREKVIENGAVELEHKGMTFVNQDSVMISNITKLTESGTVFPCLLRVYVEGVRTNAKGKEYMGLKIAYAPITQALLDAVATK